MSAVVEMKRVLKVGAAELAFPEGMDDPDAVRRLYTQTYPHLREVTINDPVAQGDKLVYEIEKPPAKTKG